jgi:voltage-gated sodium channel
MQEILTAQDQREEGPRAAAARFILRPSVQGAIMALIVLNAITLGLETSGRAMAAFGDVLMALDRLFLWIFTIEIAARIYAFRARFFRDPWGIFDLIVVGIAWLPATGPLSVLRALRVLRVLRLISMLPRLRIVVEAMLHAVPGIGAIALLMVILYYVAAVIATKLFADTHPEFFGTIGESMYTLFQIMTLESWSMGIVRPVMEASPQAWLFFIPFILVATFVMLNLFIGVIIESIQTLRKQREEAEALPGLDPAAVMRELRALREEVAALRATVGSR